MYLQSNQLAVKRFRKQKNGALSDALAESGAADGAEVVFVEQSDALGLCHALLCALPETLD